MCELAQRERGVVWCGVVWCGVVWCGVVWCGVVWCGRVRTKGHRRRLAFAPVAALNVRLDEAEHGRRRLDDVVADRGGNVGQAAPGDDGLGRVVVGVLRLRWGAREQREGGIERTVEAARQ